MSILGLKSLVYSALLKQIQDRKMFENSSVGSKYLYFEGRGETPDDERHASLLTRFFCKATGRRNNCKMPRFALSKFLHIKALFVNLIDHHFSARQSPKLSYARCNTIFSSNGFTCPFCASHTPTIDEGVQLQPW